MDTALPFPAIPHPVSAPELRSRIGRPDAPLLLDVRRRERFLESSQLLPGARWCAPEDVAAFARSEPLREVVVYCVHGHNVSSDAARELRAAGWDARLLEGGIEDAPGLPRIRKRPDLGVTGEAPSRWITRAAPKVDRIACPWLVKRFIDPRAQFFYVPTEQVFARAQELAAVPYDMPDAPITHEWERCSFDALLRAFELGDPALEALAAIVRGADTDRMAIAPQAAGLLATSLGFSRLHAGDDHAMLAAMLPVYDALYAWCREGRAETHRWQAHA